MVAGARSRRRRGARRRHLPHLVALAGLAGAALAAAAAEQAFELVLSGSPALHIGGDCLLHRGDGAAERVRLDGAVPTAFAFRAAAIDCTVRKRDARGRLRVLLRAGDKAVALRATAAPYNWVRVRSDGPWGPATSARGRQRLLPGPN